MEHKRVVDILFELSPGTLASGETRSSHWYVVVRRPRWTRRTTRRVN